MDFHGSLKKKHIQKLKDYLRLVLWNSEVKQWVDYDKQESQNGRGMKSMKSLASCHVCKRGRIWGYSNCKCVHVRTGGSRGSTNWS